MIVTMLAQASAHQGASTQCASRAAKRAFKVALPRHLSSAAALLSGSSAIGVSAASAESVPYGPGSAAPVISLPAVQAVSLPGIALPSVSLPSVDIPDVSGLLDGVDPMLLGGVLATVAVPAVIISLLGSGGPKLKAVSAAKALEALAADEYCILLDIRSKADARAAGTPNLKGISRHGAVSVPFTSLVKGKVVVDDKFGAKVARVKGVEANGAPVILFDTTGTEASAAAKAILAEVPLQRLYYVQGGADAWQAAGCPWKEPVSFSFALPELDLSTLDLSSASKTIAGGVQTTAAAVQGLATDFNEAPATAKGLLAALGVVGASALLFSQVELLFEIAGLLAAGQFMLKVVFAEDREKTLTKIKKVAQEIDVKDLPEDLGKIAVRLLEDPTEKPATVSKKVQVPEKAPAPAPVPVPVVAAAGGAEPSRSPVAPEA